ncbi:hypothetical protein BU16DRAFT_563268 [Lophium mytilinum]|uniref:Uncharacterized protein n=1 Tax=Lophium mytilinum TaxID=390894 RepID=A0A6A6QQ98_9PEZI|nr:hypothetical protein BU16DRAFT_563268 [Lophium mytilinum]
MRSSGAEHSGEVSLLVDEKSKVVDLRETAFKINEASGLAHRSENFNFLPSFLPAPYPIYHRNEVEPPFSLVSLATSGLADVLDLGDLNQYNKRKDGPPSLSGTTVWISGKEGDGFDVALSPDAEAKIQGVLEACLVPDQKCYEDVNGILVSADLEFDTQLERRALVDLLSKTAKKVGWVFSSIYLILSYRWRLKHADDVKNVFIPAKTASQLLTQPNHKGKGQTPAVTTVSKAGNGLSNGDLVALLDPELASKIQAAMSKMTDCDEGRKFDQENGSKKRAELSSLGQAICAAIGTTIQAGAGGPFDRMTLLDTGHAAFTFVTMETARAALIVADFVRAYASELTIPEESADQFANYVFALAIDSIVDKIPLGEKNRIASSLITTATSTSPSTSSTSECPAATATPLFCGYEDISNCGARLPKTNDGDVVCVSVSPACHPAALLTEVTDIGNFQKGKYQECKCNAPIVESANMASAEEIAFMDLQLEYLKSHEAKTNCTGLQSNTYVTRNVVHDLIVNTYCKLWQGDVKKVGIGGYMHDTPEDVEIGAMGDIEADGGITPEECQKWLLKVLDDCDTDATANPMNWKAGGEIKVNHWTYSIRALHDRPPAPKSPSAWCRLEDCGDSGCTARIWGAGWLTSTPAHGEELLGAFDTVQKILTSEGQVQQLGGHRGINTSHWRETWKYELKDGHEWGVEIGADMGAFLDPAKIIPNITRVVANKEDPGYLKVDDCAS